MRFDNHDFSDIALKMQIPTLESSRIRIDVIFAIKLFNKYIDCEALLKEFNFFIPRRNLRNNRNYFYVKYVISKLNIQSPTVRLSLICNQ